MYNELTFNDNRQDAKAQNKEYRLYKTDHENGNYFKYISSPKSANVHNAISKMRLGDYKLMIEKGRHLRIPAKDRLCNRCSERVVEDEFHAIIMCTVNILQRNNYGTN